MKILFLSSVYPHSRAPVRGTYNAELCRALADRTDLHVVAPLPWTEVVRQIVQRRPAAGIEAEKFPVDWPVYLYPPGFCRASYGRWMWQSIRRSVQQVTQSFRPDWVLSYWAHPDGEAGLRAARQSGAKSGVIIGGSDVLILTDSPGRRAAIVRVLTESDAVFTVCDGLRDRVIELGVQPERVHTIYQGIRPDRFRPGNRETARGIVGIEPNVDAFLFVGRLVGVKRLDVLIEAFARTYSRNSQARLYIVGTGPDQAQVADDVQRRNLADAVRLVGPVQPDRLPLWYQAANATVLSSDSEGLPNVLRESLACGTPFVATDVGSVSEIADPASSLLVPVGRPSELGDAMLQILEPRWQRGAAACQVGSWDDCASEYLSVMENSEVEQQELLEVARDQESSRNNVPTVAPHSVRLAQPG